MEWGDEDDGRRKMMGKGKGTEVRGTSSRMS